MRPGMRPSSGKEYVCKCKCRGYYLLAEPFENLIDFIQLNDSIECSSVMFNVAKTLNLSLIVKERFKVLA